MTNYSKSKTRIAIIDDDKFILESITNSLNLLERKYKIDFEISSAQNGVEGLGMIYASDPNIIIVDLTLPQYSGKEIIEFLTSNKKYRQEKVKLIVLSEFNTKKKEINLPKNTLLINKNHPSFIEQIIFAVSLFIDKNLNSIKLSNKDKLLLRIDNAIAWWGNRADKSIRNISNKSITVKPVYFTNWIISQFIASFFLTIIYLFYGKARSDEIIDKADNVSLRVNHFPTLATIFTAIIITILQVFIFIAGGVTILNVRVNSIFAMEENIVNIEFSPETQNQFIFDENKIIFTSDGISLKPEKINPTIVNLPISYTQTEDYRFVTSSPEIIIKEPISFKSLERLIEISSLNDETSSFNNPIDADNIEKSTSISYQISKDKSTWIYYSKEESQWEVTTQGYNSSSSIQEINHNIKSLQETIGSGELYIKIFLNSVNGIETPVLSKISIEKTEELIFTEKSEQPQSSIIIDQINTQSSFELDDHKPMIFNASFYNGNKIILGKLLSKDHSRNINYDIPQDDLDKYMVNIYFSKPDIASTESLIGTTNLYINSRGELEFFLKTPSVEGGFITAEVIEKNSDKRSEFARPIENSTFTVDSTGDGTDATLDGLCADISGFCTLRAAIEEANNVAGSDNINFNIPTSDPGYRDYDLPDTPSSGDSAGGDDYWTISPSNDLPAINDSLIIDGATQTLSQGDLNTQGPEIEIEFSSNSGIYGFQYDSLASNSSINAISTRDASNTIILILGVDGFTLTNSYLGTLVDGKTMSGNTQTYGVYSNFGSDNIIIGNNTSDGNVFGGFQDVNFGFAIGAACDDPSSTKRYIIRGNKIGVSADESVSITNHWGVSINGDCNIDIGGNNSNYRNIISSNTVGIIKVGSNIEDRSRIIIQNNYFGTDSSGTQNFGNLNTALNVSGTASSSIDQYELLFLDNLVRFGNSGIFSAMERNFQIENNTFSDLSSGAISLSINSPVGTGNQSDILIQGNAFGEFISDPIFGISTGENNRNITLNDVYAVVENNSIIGGTTGIQNRLSSSSFSSDIGKIQMRNNIITDQSVIAIDNIPLSGIEANPRLTINDPGDVDTGVNDLANYPIINSLSYLGSGNIELEGNNYDGLASEGPWDIEICLSSNSVTGSGDCIESVHTFQIATPGAWSTTFNLPGANGLERFSVLATNANGSTSEFSPVFPPFSTAADANPFFDGTEWVITVDTTEDLDHVSLVGDDDGDGPYSGGGLEGVDGNANGRTSLREAIIAANNFAQPVRIEFNIPATDSGYQTVVSDSYWEIELLTALPDITSEIIIDGSTQTTNQSNTNTSGPEILINANSQNTNFTFNTGSDNSEINSLTLNGAINSGIAFLADNDSFLIDNTYINTSFDGNSEIGNTTNGILFDANITNVEIGTGLTNKNVITGESYGIVNEGSTYVTGSFRGNIIGLSANESVDFNIPDGIRYANLTANSTDLVFGGTTSVDEGNILGGTRGIWISDFNNTSNLEFYNNILGTNSNGDLDTCENINLRLSNISSTNLQIGSDLAPNFFANCGGSSIWLDDPRFTGDVEVRNNYFSNNARGIQSTYSDQNIDDTVSNFYIRNNQFGSGNTTIAPEFGITLQDNVDFNEFVSEQDWGSVDVRGGNIYLEGNEFADDNHVAVRAQSVTYGRQDAANNKIPYVLIGDTNPLAGSRCGGTQENCFVVSTSDYALFVAYETKIGLGDIQHNNYTGFTSGQDYYEEYWPNLFEVFSGNIRRTDLADGDENLFGFFKTFEATCTNVGECPAVTSADGSSGTTMLWSLAENYDLGIYNSNTLLDGNFQDYRLRINYTNLASTSRRGASIEGPNFLTYPKAFSIDGDSTTAPINSSVSRIVDGIEYFDRGEPWVTNPDATGDIATQDYGFNEIVEVHLVDANPIFNGSTGEWSITVNSTSDEDNVSLTGFDDGDGDYSGGGVNGPDGLPDGRTSLREAIIVANNFSQPVTIDFNIPETDPGFINPDGSRDSTTEPVGTYTVTDTGYWFIDSDVAGRYVIDKAERLKIDGYSQPGAVRNTAITGDTLNGIIRISMHLYNLEISRANNLHITGLNIIGHDNAIQASINSTGPMDNILIEGNYLGTYVDGSHIINGGAPYGIGSGGVRFNTDAEVSNLTIGTNGDGLDDVGELNVISGRNHPVSGIITIYTNSSTVTDLRISGNYIFTDKTANSCSPLDGDRAAIELGGTLNAVGTVIGSDLDGVSDDLESNVMGCINTNFREYVRFFLQEDAIVANNYMGISPDGVDLREGEIGDSRAFRFLANNNVQFRENVVLGYDTGRGGVLNLYEDDPAFASTNILIEDNRIIGGEVGLAGSATATIIRNNIFEEQTFIPVILNTDDSEVTLSKNTYVEGVGIEKFIHLGDTLVSNNLSLSNDTGDLDSGPNDLQNYPEIKSVQYLGASQYLITGILDNNEVGEGPFDLEICLAGDLSNPTHSSGHGGCRETLFYQEDYINQVSGGINPWSATVTVTGSNGYDDPVFSTLATNTNGSTSEFSANFVIPTISYDLDLVYPVNDIQIEDTTPTFDWNALNHNGIFHPDLGHYEIYLNDSFYTAVNSSITQYTPSSNLPLGSHSWFVVAFNSNGDEIERSSVERFEIILPEFNLTPIYPVDITIDNPSPTFDWTDIEYENEFTYPIVYDLYVDDILVTSDLDISEFADIDDLSEGEHTWYVVAYTFDDDANRIEIDRTYISTFFIEIPVEPSITPTPVPDFVPVIDTQSTDDSNYTPLVVTALSYIAISSSAFVLLSGSLPAAGNYLFGFLFGWIYRRKKKYWGIVFDQSSSKPVPFALVKLRNTLDKSLITQTVTDKNGRYGALTENPGEYTIEVLAPGFNIFRNNISVPKTLDVNSDVPLIKSDKSPNVLKNFIFYSKPMILEFTQYILIGLMLVGFVYSLVIAAMFPSVINTLIFAGYLVFFVLNIFSILSNLAHGDVGVVIDQITRKPISNASVRIFKNGELLELVLTNSKGRIKFNLPPGSYTFQVSKDGYRTFSFVEELSDRGSFLSQINLEVLNSHNISSKLDNPFSNLK